MRVLVIIWVLHIIMPAWVVAPMAILGRRRAAWELWEALVFVVPFRTWAALMLSPMGTGKSLANLGEASYTSLAIVLATAVRLVWGQRSYKRALSGVLIVTVVAVAVGVFFLTGPLSEVRSNGPLQPTSGAGRLA